MTRAELHQLVDELPEESIPAATAALERALRDPLAALLDAAPEDDEPLTDEDIAEIEAGRAEIRAGSGRPWEKVREEIG